MVRYASGATYPPSPTSGEATGNVGDSFRAPTPTSPFHSVTPMPHPSTRAGRMETRTFLQEENSARGSPRRRSPTAARMDPHQLETKALERWERQKAVWQRMSTNLVRRRARVGRPHPDGSGEELRMAGGGGGARACFLSSTSHSRMLAEDFNMVQCSVPQAALSQHYSWEALLRCSDVAHAVRSVQIGRGYFPYALFGEVQDPSALREDHPIYARMIFPPSTSLESPELLKRSAARELLRARISENPNGFTVPTSYSATPSPPPMSSGRDEEGETAEGSTRRRRTYDGRSTRERPGETSSAVAIANRDAAMEENQRRKNDYYYAQLLALSAHIQKKFQHFLVPRSYLEVVGQKTPRMTMEEYEEVKEKEARFPPSPTELFPPPPQLVRLPVSYPSISTDPGVLSPGPATGSFVSAGGFPVHSSSSSSTPSPGGARSPPPPSNVSVATGGGTALPSVIATNALITTPPPPLPSPAPSLVLSTQRLLFRAPPGELVHGRVEVTNTGSVSVYYSWVPVDKMGEGLELATMAVLGTSPTASTIGGPLPPSDSTHADASSLRAPPTGGMEGRGEELEEEKDHVGGGGGRHMSGGKSKSRPSSGSFSQLTRKLPPPILSSTPPSILATPLHKDGQPTASSSAKTSLVSSTVLSHTSNLVLPSSTSPSFPSLPAGSVVTTPPPLPHLPSTQPPPGSYSGSQDAAERHHPTAPSVSIPSNEEPTTSVNAGLRRAMMGWTSGSGIHTNPAAGGGGTLPRGSSLSVTIAGESSPADRGRRSTSVGGAGGTSTAAPSSNTSSTFSSSPTSLPHSLPAGQPHATTTVSTTSSFSVSPTVVPMLIGADPELLVYSHLLHQMATSVQQARHFFHLSSPMNGVLLPDECVCFPFSLRSPYAGTFHQVYELLTVPQSSKRILIELHGMVSPMVPSADALAAPLEKVLEEKVRLDAQRQLVQSIAVRSTPFLASDMQREKERIQRVKEDAEKAKAQRQAEEKDLWMRFNTLTFDALPYHPVIYEHLSRLYAQLTTYLKKTIHVETKNPEEGAVDGEERKKMTAGGGVGGRTSLMMVGASSNMGLAPPPPSSTCPLWEEKWSGSLTFLFGSIARVRDAATRVVLQEGVDVLLRAARVVGARAHDFPGEKRGRGGKAGGKHKKRDGQKEDDDIEGEAIASRRRRWWTEVEEDPVTARPSFGKPASGPLISSSTSLFHRSPTTAAPGGGNDRERRLDPLTIDDEDGGTMSERRNPTFQRRLRLRGTQDARMRRKLGYREDVGEEETTNDDEDEDEEEGVEEGYETYEERVEADRKRWVEEDQKISLKSLLRRAADELGEQFRERALLQLQQEVEFSQYPREPVAILPVNGKGKKGGAGSSAGGATSPRAGVGAGGAAGGMNASTSGRKGASREPAGAGGNGNGMGVNSPSATLGTSTLSFTRPAPTIVGGPITAGYRQPPTPGQEEQDHYLQEYELLLEDQKEVLDDRVEALKEQVYESFQKSIEKACYLPLMEVVQRSREEDLEVIQNIAEMEVDIGGESIMTGAGRASGKKK